MSPKYQSAGRKHGSIGFARIGVAATVAGALFTGIATPTAKADETKGSAETVCEAYFYQEYDRAIDLARQIVQSDSPTTEKLDAYRCKTCSYVALSEVRPAKMTIAEMLEVDQTARFSPDLSYPPVVIDLYNAVRDSLYPGTMDINTIAVGDFEDNSIYKGKFGDYDFSMFKDALIHTINADLAEATPLKLVDRQRIDKITAELALNQNAMMDPEHAVQAGRLLGAHSFIFGQYMILSKDTVRIDARVVHTATGEIVLTKQVTGKFDGDALKFLELEKELVTSLASGIDKIRTTEVESSDMKQKAEAYFEEKEGAVDSKMKYVESKFLAAQALELEDQGKFNDAQDVWRQVLDADPRNEIAETRIRILDTLIRG